jgi:hypothetical protein
MRRPLAPLALFLIALLGIAASAQALIVPAAEQPLPDLLAAPAEGEDEAGEEGEAAASEDEGIEAEECEEEEPGECEAEASGEAPPECLLSSAEASVFASGGRNRVRLAVRYTASAPTVVAVDYGLHGSKGSISAARGSASGRRASCASAAA